MESKREGKMRVKKGLTKWDYGIFAALAVICFLLFNHTDVLHTGSSANAYLAGHFLDFYEFNRDAISGSSYYPSTYIVYAIWNLPLLFLGQLTHDMGVPYWTAMWYKLLPTLLYVFSAKVIYQTALELKMTPNKAKVCAFAFVTTPIAFYSQFMMGQYDIFTAFFIMLGILYFIRRDNFRFILFFGIATTFKYFAVLYFIPLLLLREKNIFKVIRDGIFVLLPIIIETAVYITSRAFISNVLGFGIIGYAFGVGFELASKVTGDAGIGLLVFFFVGICAWAFFTEEKDKKSEVKWAFYFMLMVAFLCYGLSMFHPQWILLVTPIMVISSFMHKKTDAFLLLDLALMLFVIMFTICVWPHLLDQNLFNNGLLRDMTYGRIDVGMTMRQVLPFGDLKLIYSVIAGIFLVNALFKHPKYLTFDEQDDGNTQVGFVRTRFLAGVAIFLVPAFICFGAMFTGPKPFHMIPLISHYEIGELTSENTVSQFFTARGEDVVQLEFGTRTFGRENEGTLCVQLIDCKNGDVLYETDIDMATCQDWQYYVVYPPKVPLIEGEAYEWRFTSPDAIAGSAAGIVVTDYGNMDKSMHCVVDGVDKEYNVCMQIWEERYRP